MISCQNTPRVDRLGAASKRSAIVTDSFGLEQALFGHLREGTIDVLLRRGACGTTRGALVAPTSAACRGSSAIQLDSRLVALVAGTV